MTGYFKTSMKKGRGRAQHSLDIIKAMHEIAEASQPITGRGVGYKLFSLNLIPSMSRNDIWSALTQRIQSPSTLPGSRSTHANTSIDALRARRALSRQHMVG
jgi:hypothetical protein